MERSPYSHHYEQKRVFSASQREIFDTADNHSNLTAHMGSSSMMMAGASMSTQIDEGKFQKVGSQLHMEGKILGVKIFLDEAVTKREPPDLKVWETVGSLRLVVIGPYQMGFEVEPNDDKSTLKLFIDYQMPKSRLLGQLFGGWYAKWCLNQMFKGVENHLKTKS